MMPVSAFEFQTPRGSDFICSLARNETLASPSILAVTPGPVLPPSPAPIFRVPSSVVLPILERVLRSRSFVPITVCLLLSVFRIDSVIFIVCCPSSPSSYFQLST